MKFRTGLEPRSGRRLGLVALAVVLVGCGGDPLTISPIEPQLAFVGEDLRVPFEVRNAGAWDIELSFSAPALTNIDRWATVVARPGGGEFQWTPTADHVGDHELAVHVLAAGRRAARAFDVRVEVARDASPVFVEPGLGGAFDVARRPCLVIPIDVRDRDTAAPSVRVSAGLPAGAELEMFGPATGELRWCPTPDQIAAAEQWTITFEASDGEHDPVLHDYRALLLRARKAPCGGRPPTIEIVSPGADERVVSLVGYDVVIRVDDDQALRDGPVLFYTDGRVGQRDQVDLSTLDFAPFFPEGDTWVAHIPTFRLAEDETKTVTLVPWLSDDDDRSGTRCDNRAELRTRRFTAVGAVEAGVLGDCEVCQISGDCISDICIRTPLGGRCVPSCDRDGRCELGECRGWSSMEGVIRSGCGDGLLVCDGVVACAPDDLEDNRTLDRATPLDAESVSATVCERDDDWFAVAPGVARRVRMTLEVDRAATRALELHAVDQRGAIVGVASAGAGEVATLERCVAPDELLFARVSSPALGRGDYGLRIDDSPEECTCIGDAGEPDGPTSRRSLERRVDAVICAGDTDWYSITGAPDTRTRLLLAFDGEAADLDMDLIDDTGRMVATSRGVDGEEVLRVDLDSERVYVLRVYAFDSREAPYSLEVSAERLAPCSVAIECGPDEICAGERCRRLLCVHDADCPDHSVCPLTVLDGTARTCRALCALDSDCRPGELCKEFFEGPVCAATGTGETGAPCTAAADCAGNRVCVDWPGGHCAAAGCERGELCNEGASCVVLDGRASCVPTCWISDEECGRGGGYDCREGFGPSTELVYGCFPETR